MKKEEQEEEIEFDEMSGEERRAREIRFNAFKEKYLRCERCGCREVYTSLTKRKCKMCGFIMPILPQNMKLYGEKGK